ncbi:MAG: DUF1266 domain-containing protein [Lachnospiraceae bacterium]|nr:DUF1266 domain-containing protein [Lachnospiraceae bacterium]
MNKSRQKFSLLFLGILLLSVMTGCAGNSGRNDNNQNNSSAEQTRKPLKTLEDPSSNLGQWGRAMGSVLIAINEGDVYYFGGYEQTDGNKEAAARILKQSWNITDRRELLVQIQNLLTTGSRKEYRKEAKEMKAMSKKELRTALKQLSGDTLNHYNMVQYNWKKWKKKGLLAWDMCRVSHLAQWGYVAGYITIEEAQALIEPAAGKIAENFDNWDDVQQNWLDGYALYAAIDAENPAGTDYEVRQKKYEELKEAQNKETKLYDDSLFTAGIVPLSGVSADTILAEVATAEKDNQKTDGKKDTDATKELEQTKESDKKAVENDKKNKEE